MWYTGKKIPTNLITGFLGTGKTTAIRNLLRHRPAGERWSVFVNEYGMVSIDDLMFEDQTPEVQIQELAGGCFCCTTSAMLDVVLMQFIRRTRPDRLLIEPSGAGHPARVIDTLRSERFRQALDLRATICLVDPKDFENPRVTNTEGFYDQIQMSDLVAINWIDKRDRSQTERCRRWIDQFDPPKLLIAETEFGNIQPEWLDLAGTVVRPPRLTNAHATDHNARREHVHETHAHYTHGHDDNSQGGSDGSPDRANSESGEPDVGPLVSLNRLPDSGHPTRLENSGNGQRACGWIFSSDDRFHRDDLFDYLGALPTAQRVKGVFHCQDDWWLLNRSGRDVSITRTAWRRDSRLEIITDDSELNWLKVESDLLANLVPPDSSPGIQDV